MTAVKYFLIGQWVSMAQQRMLTIIKKVKSMQKNNSDLIDATGKVP